MWSRRSTFGLIVGAVLVAAALFRLPALTQRVAVNAAAAATITGCAQGSLGEATVLTGSEADAAWLRAAQARCRGDEEAMRAALRETLAASDDRWELVRAAAPEDPELARFAAEKYPGRPDILFWLGSALRENKDWRGSVQAYEQGLALRSDDSYVWLNVGDIYRRNLNDTENALRAYEEACKYVDADYGRNGCRNAGEMYLKLGEYQLAADRFTTCLSQIGYTWVPVERGLGKALLGLGRTEEAVKHLRIAANRDDEESQQILEQMGLDGQ